MEAKNLKNYFLSGSFFVCIVGIIASALSLLWIILKFYLAVVFVKIYFIEIIVLLLGPVLLFATLKNTIKTYSLLSKIKRNNSIGDIYLSFSNVSSKICYKENAVIISDRYLFLRDEVEIIPYQELTLIYMQYTRNDKKEITGMQLYCNTTSKKKINIFGKVENRNELIHFLENIKQKNPSITFEL